MSATMTGNPMRSEAWEPQRRAPASGDVRRSDVNRIRNQVPELATPVWAKRLAVGLGYFSVGLGLMELLGTRKLERWFGVENARLIRAYGVREIGTGIQILMGSRLAPLLWGRVAGDVLDLGTLGVAARDEGANRRNLAIAAGAVLGVMLLDILDGMALSKTRS